MITEVTYGISSEHISVNLDNISAYKTIYYERLYNDIKRLCESWLSQIDFLGNECAYTDRLIEQIDKAAKKLNADYQNQF